MSHSQYVDLSDDSMHWFLNKSQNIKILGLKEKSMSNVKECCKIYEKVDIDSDSTVYDVAIFLNFSHLGN